MTMSRNNAGTSDEKEPQSLRSGKNVSQRVGARASRFFYHAAFFTPSILDFTVFNQFTQDDVGANIQVRAAFFSFNLFWCYRIRKVLQRILIRRHKARIFRIHAASIDARFGYVYCFIESYTRAYSYSIYVCPPRFFRTNLP